VIAQTFAQQRRTIELYNVARKALEAMSEERLNLSLEARDALNRTRGSLEEFDAFRMLIPVSEKGGAL
jgi:hypothetical protein